MVYILQKKWKGLEAGTRFYPYGDRYTTTEGWNPIVIDKDIVENSEDLFKPQNILFPLHTIIKEDACIISNN